MAHWKHKLKAKCRTIVNDMVKLYGFRHQSTWTGETAWTDVVDGQYVVKWRYPTGYVSLAIFLHEVGHVVYGDCFPDRTHAAARELRAWQFARAMFEAYGLPWTHSVSLAARNRLEGSIEDIDPAGARGLAAEAIAAIDTMNKTGIQDERQR